MLLQPGDPTPAEIEQIGQLPPSGDPRTANNYYLRVIAQLLSDLDEQISDPSPDGFNFEVRQAGGLTTGLKGNFVVPFDCEIKSVRLLANTAGNCVVDIWRDTYANYPPTNADSICAAAKPTLSAVDKMEDTTLTGWTKALSAGDVLAVNIDSVTGLDVLTVFLGVEK